MVTRKQYENAWRYIRGNDNVGYPGEEAIKAVYKAQGSYYDKEGFKIYPDQHGWINRSRRALWSRRRSLISIFGSYANYREWMSGEIES